MMNRMRHQDNNAPPPETECPEPLDTTRSQQRHQFNSHNLPIHKHNFPQIFSHRFPNPLLTWSTLANSIHGERACRGVLPNQPNARFLPKRPGWQEVSGRKFDVRCQTLRTETLDSLYTALRRYHPNLQLNCNTSRSHRSIPQTPGRRCEHTTRWQ